MNRAPTWTDDETALLARLVAANERPATIAAKFPTRSRSAVLGKAHRMAGKAERERPQRDAGRVEPPPPVVDRTPCPRCAARRDYGCPCPPTRGLTTRA